MNRKYMVLECASYILSQDHEREDLVDKLSCQEFHSKIIRSNFAKDSIWYIAMSLAYGKKEANKELKELLQEVDDN